MSSHLSKYGPEGIQVSPVSGLTVILKNRLFLSWWIQVQLRDINNLVKVMLCTYFSCCWVDIFLSSSSYITTCLLVLCVFCLWCSLGVAVWTVGAHDTSTDKMTETRSQLFCASQISRLISGFFYSLCAICFHGTATVLIKKLWK